MRRVTIVLVLAARSAIAAGQDDGALAPPGLVAAGFDTREGLVVAWYDDGMVRVGMPQELEDWSDAVEYSIPGGRTPADIAAMAVAKDGRVYTWYLDGMWSRGTAGDLGRFGPAEPYRLPDDRSPQEIVGAGHTVLSNREVIYVWYDDGMFSAGVTGGLGAYETGLPYRVAPDLEPADVVAISAGPGLIAIAWYGDGTFSIGTPADLAGWNGEVPAVEARDPRDAPVKAPAAAPPEEPPYEVHDGIAYVQGDIVLGPVDTLGGPGAPRHERAADEIACSDVSGPNTSALYGVAANRWWGGFVPYTIDESRFSPKEVASIRAAIRTINDRTNLTIKPRASEPDYVLVTGPARAGTGGTSALGRCGGGQELRLNIAAESVVLHEFLHAAGLGHEHCRHDRDQHITIIRENIEPEFARWFDIAPEYTPAPHAYDLHSIMHYSGYAFGRESRRFPQIGPLHTIVRRGTNRPVRMNHRLSALDIERVNWMYPLTLAGKAHIFIAQETGCVRAWSWSPSRKRFLQSAWPFATKCGAGDALLAGRVADTAESLVVVDGETDDVELYGYAAGAAPKWRRTLRPRDGTCLAVGDVVDDADVEFVIGGERMLRIDAVRRGRLEPIAEPLEITGTGRLSAAVGMLGNTTKAKIVCHRAGGPFESIRFSADDGLNRLPAPSLDGFVTYDPVAIANLAGDDRGELLLVDRDRGVAAMFERADVDFTVLGEVRLSMTPQDAIAVGDVWGDERAEIVIAPADGGDAKVIGWNGLHFEQVAKFRVPASGAMTIGLPAYRP